MAGRVLVTRPEPGASRTAGRLRAAGYEPVVLPLTRVVPVGIDHWPDPSAYCAVAVTSANAVRCAPPALLVSLTGKRCYAVGAATARAAREAGFEVMDVEAGDGAALAAAVRQHEAPGARILHLCGRVRTDSFTAALKGGPVVVDSLETYDTQAIDHSPDTLRRALQGNPIRAALVYSAGSATRLCALSRSPVATVALVNAAAVCISARAAAALDEGGFPERIIAERPDEKGMMEALAALR